MRSDFLIFLVATLIIIGHLVAQGAPPVADFSFSPAQPTVGEEITFIAAGSYDPDGTIQFFGWDFGDDGVIDEVGAQVRYVFRASGQYNVRLIVIDNEGLSSFAIKTLNVNEAPQMRENYLAFRPYFGIGNAFVTGTNDRIYFQIFAPYGFLNFRLVEVGLQPKLTDFGLWLNTWLHVRLFSLTTEIGETEFNSGLMATGVIALHDPIKFFSISIRQFIGSKLAINISVAFSLPMVINSWQAPFGFARYYMLNLEFCFK
ncbi:MAG: PKD domain-containing protein [Candidatus Bathyarchaeia archaeon]